MSEYNKKISEYNSVWGRYEKLYAEYKDFTTKKRTRTFKEVKGSEMIENILDNDIFWTVVGTIILYLVLLVARNIMK